MSKTHDEYFKQHPGEQIETTRYSNWLESQLTAAREEVERLRKIKHEAGLELAKLLAVIEHGIPIKPETMGSYCLKKAWGLLSGNVSEPPAAHSLEKVVSPAKGEDDDTYDGDDPTCDEEWAAKVRENWNKPKDERLR